MESFCRGAAGLRIETGSTCAGWDARAKADLPPRSGGRRYFTGMRNVPSGCFQQVGGNFYRDQGAAARVADDFKAGLVAVEDFETLLDILHADAGTGAAQSGYGAIAHAYAIVRHFN